MLKWMRKPPPPIRPQPGLEYHVLVEALDNRNDKWCVTMRYSGEVLVERTVDPEPAACRALVARGVTAGKLVTFRAGNDQWQARSDIVKTAKLTTVDRGWAPYKPWGTVEVDDEAAEPGGGESPDRAPEPVEA
jgi:hypothetical protein